MTFMGSPKSRKTFWGEEEQRNERDLPLAAGRGIWSLRRRSERENAVRSGGRNGNRGERYAKEIESAQDSLDKVKAELAELGEDKDKISLKLSEYSGEEWELPEVPAFMSAKTYRAKFALPLINKLMNVIRNLVSKVVDISKQWGEALRARDYFHRECKNLEKENHGL